MDYWRYKLQVPACITAALSLFLVVVILKTQGLYASPPDDAAGRISELWGQTGERWNPRNCLPDFSYAGYQMGEKPILSVPVWKNLNNDYGAQGDGVADDSAALIRATEDFPGTTAGAIYLSQGTYRISERIVIRPPSSATDFCDAFTRTGLWRCS